MFAGAEMIDAKRHGSKRAETIPSCPSRRNLLLFSLACIGLLLWPAAPSDEAIAQRARGWQRTHPSSTRTKPGLSIDSQSDLSMDARSFDSDSPGDFDRAPAPHPSEAQGPEQGASYAHRKRRRDSRCREVEEPDYRWEGPDAGKRPFCTDASSGAAGNIR
jgi:hypothetical protein